MLLLLPLLLMPTAGSMATAADFEAAPRDPDGRYRNLGEPLASPGLGVRLPFFFRRVMSSLRKRDGAPPRIANDGATLRATERALDTTVTWIGHATMLVQMEGVSFLTDPTWSRTASPLAFAGPRRLVAPGLEIVDLPPIDFVVISHNHYDHLDLGSLEALAAAQPDIRFLVPLGNGTTLRTRGLANVEELDWGQSVRVGGVEVLCLPSRHWSQRGLGDHRRALWASWAVLGDEQRVWFAGDTAYGSLFAEIGERHGPFDLALVPIGAYAPRAMMADSHVNPEEALQIGLDVRAERILGMHYGTFDLSDEPPAEPPARLRAASADAGVDAERILLPSIGQSLRF